MDMRSGSVAQDINSKFNELVSAVLETGAKGELTVKLLVKPSKYAMGGAVVEVEAEHEVKSKVPELKVGKSVFFITKDGRMTREDPAQSAMFEQQEITQNG